MTLATPLRLPLFGALLGLNLAAQAAPSAPVAVSFDTTPRAGQHQRLQIDLQATMKMRVEAGPEATDEQRAKIATAAENIDRMGPMKMAMRMEQTMKVDAPDAEGWLPISLTVGAKSGSVEINGKPTQLPNLAKIDMSFAARFNPKDFGFEMQKFEGGSPEMNEAMLNQGKNALSESLQLFKALSQRPLKIGESVEVPLKMALPMPLPGGAGAMQGQVRYTLKRVDKGVAHFDLNMELDMKVDTPAAQARGRRLCRLCRLCRRDGRHAAADAAYADHRRRQGHELDAHGRPPAAGQPTGHEHEDEHERPR